MAEVLDPYLDPDTGLLSNLVGARTKADLEAAEGALVFARLVQLVEHPVPATGDLDEFRAIHRHLFQDVYAWAGQLRTVDLRKNVDGADFFLPVVMIGRASQYAAEELQGDRMLSGLDRERFIERLSYHYDQWNYLHPFREGNGRTQRVFWNRIAADAGWQLDWRGVQGAVNDAACRAASDKREFGPLRAMFDQVVHPIAAHSPATRVEKLGFRPVQAPTAPSPARPDSTTAGPESRTGKDPRSGLGV